MEPSAVDVRHLIAARMQPAVAGSRGAAYGVEPVTATVVVVIGGVALVVGTLAWWAALGYGAYRGYQYLSRKS